MAKNKGEQIKQNQDSSCYKPKGNVNLDNPPKGGTGVPRKPK